MSGPDTGSPPSGPKLDRVLALLDAAYDSVMRRLGGAIATGDRVEYADAKTSEADLRAAAFMRGGLDPADLDRNGWPLKAGFSPTTSKEFAMRGTNPHPQPSSPQTPPPPRG